MPYFQEDCALPLHVVYRQCETLLGSVARPEQEWGEGLDKRLPSLGAEKESKWNCV